MPREIRNNAVETAFIAPRPSEHLAALHLLPEDLLILIIEECMNLSFFPSSHLETLRQLRLTHPRFTHNTFLKSKTFSTLIIRRTRPQEALPGIAPYVRGVVFQHEESRSSKEEVTALELLPPTRNYLLSAFLLLPNVDEVRVQGACMDAEFVKFPPVDPMFEVVFSGINRSKIKLLSLCIGGHSSTQFVRSSCLQEFPRLDLTSLKKQKVHPRNTLDEMDVLEAVVFQDYRSDLSNFPGREVGLSITSLLCKCAQSLQDLSLQCDTFLLGQSWSESPPPTLPALSTLLLESGFINLPQVTLWLGRCTGLKKLVMKDLWLGYEAKMSDWRSLFDLVKYHSNDIEFELDVDSILPCCGSTVALTYNRADYAQSPQGHDGTDLEEPKICGLLKDYMSSRRGWITEQEENEERERLQGNSDSFQTPQ